MTKFGKNVVIIGYGSVAQCTLPVFLKHMDVPASRIKIIEFEDCAAALKPYIDQGLTHIRQRITPENLSSLLGTHLTMGDLLIDLAWNIDCCEIVSWCHDRGVFYINTSLELWNPYAHADRPPTEKTLYHRHMQLRKMVAGWSKPGPTAIVEHGANPGLISHFVKRGLTDISRRLIADGRATPAEAEQLEHWIAEGRFNRISQQLGVKVIHCSERDTQISNRPKKVDEFINTWSVEGFHEEGTTTSEMGWGTHEKQMPAFAYEHKEGPRNQICLARMGMNTWVKSWVPHYKIRGMVVRHGEAFTISDRLTVYEDDKAVYRPTVHYAYCPCDAAIASLHELRSRDYKLQTHQRIMSDEITEGSDILGALLMGHSYQSWWVGSRLSIEQSRRLIPHQNATTLQVAISVVAAVMWIIRNPQLGVRVPDDLPHEEILEVAMPYLGDFISTPSDWTPLQNVVNAFEGFKKLDLDWDDPWQFKNFNIAAE